MHYRSGTDWLRNSPAEKDLDILVDANLNVNHWCILILKNANTHESSLSWVWLVDLKEVTLLYLTPLKTHMDYCVQVWLSAFERFYMLVFNWRLDAENEIWKTEVKYEITPYEYRCFYLTCPFKNKKEHNPIHYFRGVLTPEGERWRIAIWW